MARRCDPRARACPDIEPFDSLIRLYEVVAWAGLEDGVTTSGLGRLSCLCRPDSAAANEAAGPSPGHPGRDPALGIIM